MIEADANDWVVRHFGEAAHATLAAFCRMVADENGSQNLVSPASLDQIWVRHVVDSAQLLLLAPHALRSWADIGTGAGFPGLVIAILAADVETVLIEPRARRADFLRRAVADLGLTNVVVHAVKADSVPATRFDVISARAVAALPVLFAMTGHLRHRATRMILPRGRNGATELAQLPRQWRGMFHVEHSVTDPESLIVVADGVTN